MSITKALKIINNYTQKGWKIEYDVVDQELNGYWTPGIDNPEQMLSPEELDRYMWKRNSGLPHFTYTSYVYKPDNDDCDENYRASFDTLNELYIWVAKKLTK